LVETFGTKGGEEGRRPHGIHIETSFREFITNIKGTIFVVEKVKIFTLSAYGHTTSTHF
jgi:hypothetical protein